MSDKNFANLCVYLERLEATPGKKDIAAILAEIKSDPAVNTIAQEFLSIAMDWYRIYGLGEKSLQKFEGDNFDDIKTDAIGFTSSWKDFVRLVEKLQGLKGSPNNALKRDIAFFLSQFPEVQKKWLLRALLKNLRAGFSEKTINKVWPKLINFFEVQLADSCENADDAKFPCILEPKLDGIRAICRVNPKAKTVAFLSRGGQPLYNTYAAGIDDYLLSVVKEETIFDGELYNGNFNETQGVTSDESPDEKKADGIKRLRFFVFDSVTAKEWDDQKCSRTYKERREGITFSPMNKDGTISDALVVKTRSHPVADLEALKALNTIYLNYGLEGVMLKTEDGLYEFKRSKAWLKHKPVETHDFVILGVVEGNTTKKYKGKVGALLLDLGDGLKCECGSGLTDEQRTEWFTKPPKGVYAEVKFKMKTPDGLLREPVFVRLRPDKKKEV